MIEFCACLIPVSAAWEGAPVAYFPFGGMRESFLGVLHGQMDLVDFFTDRKVVIARWKP
jgi:acyl-CoA reductase-like NAD-dependent aldehyde dehydrogenase